MNGKSNRALKSEKGVRNCYKKLLFYQTSSFLYLITCKKTQKIPKMASNLCILLNLGAIAIQLLVKKKSAPQGYEAALKKVLSALCPVWMFFMSLFCGRPLGPTLPYAPLQPSGRKENNARGPNFQRISNVTILQGGICRNERAFIFLERPFRRAAWWNLFSSFFIFCFFLMPQSALFNSLK